MPLNFYSGGKVYKDWVDVTPSQAYELFLKDPEAFKTSAASVEDCLKAYREASRKAREILFITISTKLSAVYNATTIAKDLVQTELPDTTIELFDSRTATAAEGFIALAAARAAVRGNSLAEVRKAADDMRDRVTLVAVMDTIRYVYRTGRIPKVASLAGSMLNIKPVFTISDGVPHFLGTTTNKGRSIKRLLKMMKERVDDNPVHVAVMHFNAPHEAENLKEQVSSQFNCVELWVTEFSPVMGYACGTGTLGLAFYKE